MTITKAELIAVVNKTLLRAYSIDGTDLDIEIINSLKDVSKKDNFLRNTSVVPTIVGRDYYDVPADFRDELIVETADHFPLEYEPIDKFRVNLKSATTGTPHIYTWFGKYFYVRPTPSAVANMNLDYGCYHAKDADAITFDDIYCEAIQDRLIWYVAKSLNLYDIAEQHNKMYLGEIADLSRNVQRLIPGVMDRDTQIVSGLSNIKRE